MLQNELPEYSTGPLCPHLFSYPNGTGANFMVVLSVKVFVRDLQEHRKWKIGLKVLVMNEREFLGQNNVDIKHLRGNYLVLKFIS